MMRYLVLLILSLALLGLLIRDGQAGPTVPPEPEPIDPLQIDFTPAYTIYTPVVFTPLVPRPYNIQAADINIFPSDMPAGFTESWGDEAANHPDQASGRWRYYWSAELVGVTTSDYNFYSEVYYTTAAAEARYDSLISCWGGGLAPLGSQSYGDESFACRPYEDDAEDNYILIVRRGNVVIHLLGWAEKGQGSLDHLVPYLQLMLGRIG